MLSWVLSTVATSLFIIPDPENVRPKGSAAQSRLHLPPRARMLALLGSAQAWKHS